MKKTLFVLMCIITISSSAQVHLPAPSPTQTIKQDFGMSSVELTYSRPGLKGRKIIGDIEPYGVIWRTGANAATKIRFNEPVEIMGNKVDTGVYAIYTIPEKDKEWTFILNRGANNSGVDGYKESEDIMRAKVKPVKLNPLVETFTMQFGNIRPESMDLFIRWEDVGLTIPITTHIKEKLRAQLDAAMQTETKPYWTAAQFYFEYDHNNPKALEMINKAIEQNAKDNPFYMVYYKAKVQKEMGDPAGARATAIQSIAMAKEANNKNYVLLNKKLISGLK